MTKKVFCILFTCIIVISFCVSFYNPVFSQSESKSEQITIKVPDFDDKCSVFTDKIGNRTGYSYEVLQEIAKYTNWNYEYVKCDESNAIDMLKNGELDIIDYCTVVENPDADVLLSNVSMGVGSKTLVAKSSNNNINPNDFENYNDLKIGIVDNYFMENAINKICEEKNFSPTIVKFNSFDECYKNLQNNSVDAILTMSIQDKTNQKILYEFPLEEFYFAVNSANKDFADKIDDALKNIYIGDRTFFSSTYNKYYKNSDVKEFVLTDDEKQYVKEHNLIKASASSNKAPFSYFDEDGNYAGIVCDIIKLASEKAGFTVEFEKSENFKDMFKKVSKGDINIVCDLFYDYSWAEKNGLKITSPYIPIIQYSIIANSKKIEKGDIDLKNNNYKIAYVDNNFFNEKFLFPNFDKKQFILYSNELKCVEAVNSGDADITFVPNYVANGIIKHTNYYDIYVVPCQSIQHGLSVGVGKNEDTRLITIFNKALKSISSDEINYIVNKHMMYQKNDIDFITFVERHAFIVIIILLIFILIGINVVIGFFKVKKSYDRTIFDLAYTDKITDVWNINGFISELHKKIEDSYFKNKDFSIISFDISKFRVINEHYGKFVGDRVLKFIANTLNNEVPYGSIVSRSVMDNFFIMIPISEKKDIVEFIKKVVEKTRFYEEGGVTLKLNYQCGIYIVTDKTMSIDKAIDMADIARKEAKNSNKNKLVFFDKKMENKILRYKEIEDNMENALGSGEFVVYYQPKVDMKTENIIGAEALVRWISKTMGFMNPGEFIPIFEKEGFKIELDFYVLEEVFKLIKEWLDNGKEPIVISVNQSRVHLSNPYYIERLENLIKKYKVPTKYIELELTENLFMEADAALETVNKIKELGFSVSVDDFGSGFSSLNMLKSMPIDVVKIDREFLNESENSEKAQKIICKIVEMAKELNMDVICEGVEKQEQAVFLKSIGCYYAQGFLYAKPMPETEFRDRVKSVIDKKK